MSDTRKSHGSEILVVCPRCGLRRIANGNPGRYHAEKVNGRYQGERMCKACAAMKRGEHDRYRMHFDAWDHDPWKSIQCEAVTANQLLDGWTA